LWFSWARNSADETSLILGAKIEGHLIFASKDTFFAFIPFFLSSPIS